MPIPLVKAGDLIAIPFAEGIVAVGLVLQRSHDLLRGCLLVGFYDRTFATVGAIPPEQLGGPFIATPQYLHQWSVRKGLWPVIGHRDDLLATAPLPVLRMSYDLYRGDEHVGRVTPEEFRHYPSLRVQGDGYVEGVLRDHFLKQ